VSHFSPSPRSAWGRASWTLLRPVLVAVVLGSFLRPLRAENVDLSTVPTRSAVQLTIYNSEDITLVRETRAITFKKGVNPLQFSWANTLIDPSSVELKFLTSADKLEVVDTTFPHAKPQMLYWNVQSEIDGEAKVQITYFTSGITWSADYLGIADKAEKQVSLEGFVRVFNNSGEEYENAQVRLVVGTINLVEKIARLASISEDDAKKGLANGRLDDLRKKATHDLFERGEAKMKAADKSGEELAEKQIVKEGLSEYFIYTIEGTETIKNGWSKRMRSLEGKQVPFQIEYRYRPQEYGEQLVRMYLLKNDVASKLGTTPLPDGMVRIFRDNGREGLSYLAQQAVKYIPIGDKIELNLGPDPEVLFELKKLKVRRDKLWLQINGKNLFRMIGGDVVKVEENSTLVGWDEHEIYSQRIRNYSGKDIHVEVRRAWPGHIIFRSLLEPKLHDYQTAEFNAKVAAGKTADLLFEIVRHQGRNAKQNNITLENAEIKP
jgi:hypothetical protein